jgi:hypothetical protein
MRICHCPTAPAAASRCRRGDATPQGQVPKVCRGSRSDVVPEYVDARAAACYVGDHAKVQTAFVKSGGVGWSNRTGCVFCAIARFFRPGYQANIVDK